MNASTWTGDWNDIIRNVFFQDEELRSLMKVPEDISIIDFIDKYFIEASFSNELLINEPVRIVYGDIKPMQTNNPRATMNEKSFDIYVKREDLHNIGKDRLLLRTKAIADRIIYLMTHDRYLNAYRFWCVGDNDMATTTVGYARRNVSFAYLKIYA